MGVALPAPNEAIKALEDVLGNDSTREVVRLYLHDFPEAIRRVGAADRENQMRIVHGLKSSSLHMGATSLSDLLASLEEKLGAQKETLAPEDLAPAVGGFGAISPGLRAYAGTSEG
jgi:HPt (histidine-containing phosphotransfer) domain-containing protein